MERNVQDLNYRELQALAKKMKLPGNLKQHLLIEVILARRSGSENSVQRILNQQKVERAKRKSEKYGTRESVFKYNITHDKRPPGRPRKNPVQEKQVQRTELNMTSLSYGSLSLTQGQIFKPAGVTSSENLLKHLEHARISATKQPYCEQFQTMKLSRKSSSPDLRELLTMSPSSFQQIIKQTSINAKESSLKHSEKSRVTGISAYYGQGVLHQYDFQNNQIDPTLLKTCQSLMSGGSLKQEISQPLGPQDCIGRNPCYNGPMTTMSEVSRDINFNNTIPEGSDNFIKSLNIPPESNQEVSCTYPLHEDEKMSFQMCDILSKKFNESNSGLNSPSSFIQFHHNGNYPVDNYSNANMYNSSGQPVYSQYYNHQYHLHNSFPPAPDGNNQIYYGCPTPGTQDGGGVLFKGGESILRSNSLQPIWHPLSESMTPPLQEIFWKQTSASNQQHNLYKFSSRREGSADSDTQSATEQDPDTLQTDFGSNNFDFKINPNTMNHYNYYSFPNSSFQDGQVFSQSESVDGQQPQYEHPRQIQEYVDQQQMEQFRGNVNDQYSAEENSVYDRNFHESSIEFVATSF